MSILVLGGTGDARQIAQRLHNRNLPVIYSVAGLVRQPELPCRVVSGGFSQFGGLISFLKKSGVNAVMDATHPYAAHMSRTAVSAARLCQIPVWRYLRPPWLPQPGDEWHEFADWQELPPMLRDRNVVFFASGQLPRGVAERLQQLAQECGQTHLLRTAVQPQQKLPESMISIEGIGPFSVEQERIIFSKFGVDALISKNSGGTATAAKLAVARERDVPVYMLQRPLLPTANQEFDNIDSCIDFVGSESLGAA